MRTQFSAWVRFLKTESAGGVVLLAATVVALLCANTPAHEAFHTLWEHTFAVGSWRISLHRAINEGLMTLFFLVVGMEIQRELLHGALASLRRAAFPAFAALGGMVVPALLYVAVAGTGPLARGWGIPMATDIAFAVGIMSLLGPRVPLSVKIYLTSLAIVDDIGGVLVIAVFYTASISWLALVAALLCIGALLLLRWRGVQRLSVYLLVGLLLWGALLQAGVHATIAGVVVGLCLPVSPQKSSSAALGSAFDRLEQKLHAWVSFGIVPLFALSNAGVSLSLEQLQAAGRHRLPWALVTGLVVGKPVGVWLASRASLWLGWSQKPTGASSRQLVAAAVLAGIGFTMSLFVTQLSFADPGLQDKAKIGILLGSLVSALLGVVLFAKSSQAAPPVLPIENG